MIAGWKERVAWSKENRWESNDVTSYLLSVFDEDIAIMIWDQYRFDSLKMLDGSLHYESSNLFKKLILRFFSRDRELPLENIKRLCATPDGREKVEKWLFNPWTT